MISILSFIYLNQGIQGLPGKVGEKGDKGDSGQKVCNLTLIWIIIHKKIN